MGKRARAVIVAVVSLYTVETPESFVRMIYEKSISFSWEILLIFISAQSPHSIFTRLDVENGAEHPNTNPNEFN